nr:hypothetical protein [Nanoarchaeum sp.]
MLDQIKDILKELKDSKEFKKFQTKNPTAYLCNVCRLDDNWQPDYYEPEKDKIVSFTKQDGEFISQESEIFRKEKTKLDELNLNEIKIDLAKAEEIMSSKYPVEPSQKIIVLLKDKIPMWNITYLTLKLEIINMKIDAISGKIIEDKIESAWSLVSPKTFEETKKQIENQKKKN